MHVALGLVALVVVATLCAATTKRLGLSGPLSLTIVGVAGSYLPFVPDATLTPELVLVGLLPPLLYTAAIRTSLVDLRANRRPIASLSVGLVLFTAFGVATGRMVVAADRLLDRPSRWQRSSRHRTRSRPPR